ncbi:hypothetical protein TREES_T100017514 [Tupaia chinensis]|uniref:Uncharacterized protein n=1 Tax=Tupaia chinensis TaxID=246437 RepID=L9LCF6_TUPCH|nr:hypothetical protein TREES_T100017514 [Tupaia chinensis]
MGVRDPLLPCSISKVHLMGFRSTGALSCQAVLPNLPYSSLGLHPETKHGDDLAASKLFHEIIIVASKTQLQPIREIKEEIRERITGQRSALMEEPKYCAVSLCAFPPMKSLQHEVTCLWGERAPSALAHGQADKKFNAIAEGATHHCRPTTSPSVKDLPSAIVLTWKEE